MTKHIVALDGVRGVAVILVLLFHFGLFPAGWVGVQLFFVLSGYLITGILLESRRIGLGAALWRFYWRRGLRILPVFLIFILAMTVSWLAVREPVSFPVDIPWIATFTANLARLRSADIGEHFVHMWSLAVEEQFYLLWPFAVLLLPRQLLGRVLWVLVLATPLLRLLVFHLAVSAGGSVEYAGRITYVLPFTQFDAFAAGALLALKPALVERVRTPLFCLAVVVTGMLGFAVLMVEHFIKGGAIVGSLGYAMFLTQEMGYFWGYTVLNVLFAMLVAIAIRDANWARPLSVAPLVFIGRISYGLYVYHLPLLLGIRKLVPLQGSPWALPSLVLFLSWLVISLVVAWASFRFIERPVMSLKDRFVAQV
jgi:peptidoglycan/LPS O-acetylase OafA/YrhL